MTSQDIQRLFSSYESYEEYIDSDEWRERASRIRMRDGYCCQICGATDVPMEVHHLTYTRLYEEDDGDLLTLCHECHEKVTKLWREARDGAKAKKHFLNMQHRYNQTVSLANQLNVLMPYDISFGGEYVMTGVNNIRAACEDIGIEFKHAQRVNDTFAKIHVFDVAMQISQGASRWGLKERGYPKALVDDVKTRINKIFGKGLEVSPELICFMHEGKSKWTAIAEDDGLDTGFNVTFMPFIRYDDRWWDSE